MNDTDRRILQTVRPGTETLTAIKNASGLSTGATIVTLDRLEADGLCASATLETETCRDLRAVRHYHVTRLGKQALDASENPQ